MLEKLKDRYSILIIILVIIFLVITFRLATLTIVHGDEYREKSDTKRVKELPITAPRGNIRDRYGRILAGTKPSFTVQIMKDELDKNRFNEIALKLVTLLEEEGENYVDEFPIELNKIVYRDENYYINNDEEPEDEIVNLIVSENLVDELLDTHFVNKTENHEFSYFTTNKALNVLENEGNQIPIKIDMDNEGGIIYSYNNNIDIEKWKKTYGIPSETNPKNAILKLINNDKRIIKKILGNSIVRELAFNMLNERGLVNKYRLEDYVFSFDEEFKSIKRDLIKNGFNNITMESTAEEDFVNIVLDTAAEELFGNVYELGNEGNEKTITPGKMLLDKFSENNIVLPIVIDFDEGKKTITYRYKDEKSKISFYDREGIEKEKNPRDALIDLGKKTGFINEIITDDNVKGIAQQIMLKKYNPKISIANWEYVSLNNKTNWMNSSSHRIPEGSSAEESFEALRERFQIDKEFSKYEARYVFLIKEHIEKQGYRAYQPVNISYDIKDETVARISESNLDLPGVKVTIEPIRYYPMGETAAHILGYLGKISQPTEIEKYINKLGYSPNDIIGKIGVEETFEKYLNGEDGTRKVEVDALGNTIMVLDEKKAIPGNDLYLTIDAKLQQVAEESLKYALEEIQIGGEYKSKWGNYNYKDSEKLKNATSGSVVAIDIKTGEVLALANYPAYNPNLFATGISTEDWDSLKPEHEEDPLAPKPLYNIAIQTSVQPGSTFKMITGLAGLEKGISPNTKIKDMGYVEIGNQKFGCWIFNSTGWNTHGYENLYEAIRDSCNYYFYTLTLGKNLRTGEQLGIKVDIEDITRMATEFGLNDKTGIEIAGEVSGGVPDPVDKVTSTKIYLRRFLNRNIRNYIKNDVTLNENEIENLINEIVSWVNIESPLTRPEVIKLLSELEIDPYKKNEKGIPIVDIIKYSYLNEAAWKAGDTLNISIGQGRNSYTPIQMANYIATLANDGYRNKVSVVKKVQSFDSEMITYEPEKKVERVNISDYQYLEEVKRGMEMVTAPGGTAHLAFKNFTVKVAAKTGTAERDGLNPVTKEEYDNFAWFVAYAPADDPQIAIATVLFQGGHGGYAAPVAREIIAQYLGFNNKSEKITLTNKMVR